MYSYEVAIVEDDTDRTITSVKVESKRRAEQVERGMNINLDHRFYYTEIREIVPDVGQSLG